MKGSWLWRSLDGPGNQLLSLERHERRDAGAHKAEIAVTTELARLVSLLDFFHTVYGSKSGDDADCAAYKIGGYPMSPTTNHPLLNQRATRKGTLTDRREQRPNQVASDAY
jgi:hypothetical protein